MGLSENTATVGSDILIIDDTPTNLKILVNILGQRGYNMRVATEGKRGIQSALMDPPDLILLDIMMPVMDGYAVCTELKRHEPLADVPVVFISALSETFNKVRAFEAGGVDYITKPFQVAEVIARVETHLTLHHLRRQERLWAVQQERERIARDLHDAVNQTLFTLGVKAQLLQIQQADQDQALAASLGEIHKLAKTAIAEMRVLLFELRPDSLARTPLARLIEQLAQTLRVYVQVRTQIDDNCYDLSLPADVHIAFYRIAQEAINNVIKHALATQVVMQLHCNGQSVSLQIDDDGKGFDPAQIPYGHFGLQGMRERAARQNIRLTLVSQAGKGTRIHVLWQPAPDAESTDATT
jgi:two-component system, sensor histidine kinase and response regulator